MKIVLAVKNEKGKNVVFVTDTLCAYSLDEAVHLAKQEKIEDVYAVERKGGSYLRTFTHVPKKEELRQLSVSSHQLFGFANDMSFAMSNLALNQYLQLYELELKRREKQPFIAIGGIARISKRYAQEKLNEYKNFIFTAANKFNVDPYLLGAIIIDEIARFGLLEPLTDPLFGYFMGLDASAGIAQVTIETARGLIRDGYYNPNPNDPKLSPQNIGKVSRRDLYEYVKQAQHSIFFGAAKVRETIDMWKKFIDLTAKLEIIATLYLLYKEPHANPQPNQRGLQIAEEFYKLAQEWLQ